MPLLWPPESATFVVRGFVLLLDSITFWYMCVCVDISLFLLTASCDWLIELFQSLAQDY